MDPQLDSNPRRQLFHSRIRYDAPPYQKRVKPDSVIQAAQTPGTSSWILEETLEAHTDWVRDVAWAPNVGLPRSYIASCGQDRRVFIWTKDGDGPGKKWEHVALDASALEGAGNEGEISDSKFEISSDWVESQERALTSN